MTADEERHNCREAYSPAPIPQGFDRLEQETRRNGGTSQIEGSQIGNVVVDDEGHVMCETITQPVVVADRAVVSVRLSGLGVRANYWMIKHNGAWNRVAFTADTCSL